MRDSIQHINISFLKRRIARVATLTAPPPNALAMPMQLFVFVNRSIQGPCNEIIAEISPDTFL